MTAIERVREIVADALGLDLAEIGPSASMETVEVWDSLQHLAVVTAVEIELSTTLSPEQVTELSSVSRIAALFEGQAFEDQAP